MEVKEELERKLRRGEPILPMPDGPMLPAFGALELAQALEHEVNRAHGAGHTNIRIDVTLDDAQKLAQFLRRGALLGAG